MSGSYWVEGCGLCLHQQEKGVKYVYVCMVWKKSYSTIKYLIHSCMTTNIHLLWEQLYDVHFSIFNNDAYAHRRFVYIRRAEGTARAQCCGVRAPKCTYHVHARSDDYFAGCYIKKLFSLHSHQSVSLQCIYKTITCKGYKILKQQ